MRFFALYLQVIGFLSLVVAGWVVDSALGLFTFGAGLLAFGVAEELRG